MDYGKLAYLKALDLEGRLGIKKENFGVWYADYRNLPAKMTFVTQIESSGDVAVFIRASASADFYVDAKKVGSGQNVFFLYNGGSIYVDCKEVIKELSIIAIGNVKSAVKLGIANADLSGEYIAYVINENGETKGYLYHIATATNEDVGLDGFSQGDVCVYNGNFLFIGVTPDGTLYMYSTDGQMHSYDLGAKCAAVSACGDEIYVAYVQKGALFYFVLNHFGDDCSPVKLMFNGSVDEVRLSKRGSGLCFSSGGKCYFKELGATQKLNDKIYVKISKEVV